VIIDTSNLVTLERRGHGVAEILEQIQRACGETRAGLSAVTVVELAHGIERAKTEAQRQRRKMLLEELRAATTVRPLTDEIAERAGAISGRQAERGVILPFADLLIGATALHHGFEVVTENARHFETIPDLVVKKFQEGAVHPTLSAILKINNLAPFTALCPSPPAGRRSPTAGNLRCRR
jgi:predicted nucleic acid-binding protein